MKNTVMIVLMMSALAFGTEFECSGDDPQKSFKSGYRYAKLGKIEEAIRCYKIACDQDHMRACVNLGVLYAKRAKKRTPREKESVENFRGAFKLWKKACRHGVARGCSNLATLYEYGFGLRKNYSLAEKYFNLACRFGDRKSCEEYSRLESAGYIFPAI